MVFCHQWLDRVFILSWNRVVTQTWLFGKPPWVHFSAWEYRHTELFSLQIGHLLCLTWRYSMLRIWLIAWIEEQDVRPAWRSLVFHLVTSSVEFGHTLSWHSEVLRCWRRHTALKWLKRFGRVGRIPSCLCTFLLSMHLTRFEEALALKTVRSASYCCAHLFDGFSLYGSILLGQLLEGTRFCFEHRHLSSCTLPRRCLNLRSGQRSCSCDSLNSL